MVRLLAVLVFLDVTQRLQSLETNLLLSQVVEQIADGVLLTDKQRTIEYVNPAFESITGFSHEEVWAKTPRVLRSGQTPAANIEKKARARLWTGFTGQHANSHPAEFRVTTSHR
jgi:PAS domain S-box-containing protein